MNWLHYSVESVSGYTGRKLDINPHTEPLSSPSRVMYFYNFLNLFGTFDSLCSNLIFPNTITHHPQIATTPLPKPVTTPSAPIVRVLYATTLISVDKPTNTFNKGLRAGLECSSYLGTSVNRMISAMEIKPDARQRQRNDSSGVRVS